VTVIVDRVFDISPRQLSRPDGLAGHLARA
jgi:hypothetical protein